MNGLPFDEALEETDEEMGSCPPCAAGRALRDCGAEPCRGQLTGDMKQEILAKKAKVPRGDLAALQAGHKKNPSLAVLQRLAKALGVSVTELLG